MSKLEVPLRYRTLWLTGDVLLWAELPLLVRDSSRNWQPVTFRYDSGSEMTTMPAARAKQYGIPFPQHPFLGLTMTTPTGTVREVRPGVIKIQVAGMDGTEYWIPCYFLGDPKVPLPPSPTSRATINLLGLSGVVNQLRIATDGTPTPNAAFGNVIVEKIIP